ncbi:hypothetical protein MATL_G00201410 [Megalops atlanticus]|uniref:DNA polymerase zeta catalytic subunit N-terminal domain-containing protein n=1 Tax=Megalops atlanticus TaxID=7932 RepID=A0A9D3PI47_MEGAT|nr:hypothetical protein MATL_G00201410 [Megalops atlanticus]
MFAVRIVTADYYMASPIKDLDVCYSEFRESDAKRVPVVRIFGATPAGNVCASFAFLIIRVTPADCYRHAFHACCCCPDAAKFLLCGW